MKRIVILLALLCASAGLALAQQTVVSGRLVGSDGKPMPKAHVQLFRNSNRKPLAMAEAGKDGSYSVSTNEAGLLRLQFTGVNHQMEQTSLFVEKPAEIKLDVRLKTYDYEDNFDKVGIIGDFNHFSFGSAQTMVKNPDGTFTAEFETSSDRFAYELVGIDKGGHSINGTQSEDFVYDNGGDYQSIITPKNGKVKIVFDPKRVVRSNSEAEIKFQDPNSTVAKIAKVFEQIQKRDQVMTKYLIEQKKAGKDPREAFESYDWSSELTALSKQISEEKEPVLRKALLFSYLSIPTPKKDQTFVKTAFAEIEPTSAFWSANPFLLSMTGEEYSSQVLDKHPDPNVKGYVLYNELAKASFQQQSEKVKLYYDRLTKDYPDTTWAKQAERFSPNLKVVVGKSVPAFSFASLEDPQKKYTNDTFKGKFYLIDFWATWCGPCLGEMDHLHKAYEKFKGKNLEILSLSFDAHPDDVIKFRQDKWKMPWFHSFVNGGFTSEAAKQFEVTGIPRTILIDGEGRIVATEVELRGDNLEKTLARFLGEPK